MRTIVNAVFSARRVATLAQDVRRRARAIIDDVSERGACDFAVEIADALPLAVICDLMGVPEADRQAIRRLSQASHPLGDPEFGTFDDAYRAVGELIEYGKALLRERLERPSDDLGAVLSAAGIDEDDGGTFFELLITRNRYDRRNDRTRPPRAHREPRPARPLAGRLRPARGQRDRGDPALVDSRRPLPPNRDRRHRARRRTDRGRRQGRSLLQLRESRRDGVRSSRPFRRHTPTQSARHLRRRRAALLSRCPPGSTGAENGVSRALRAPPRHRGLGHARAHALHVLQRRQVAAVRVHAAFLIVSS